MKIWVRMNFTKQCNAIDIPNGATGNFIIFCLAFFAFEFFISFDWICWFFARNAYILIIIILKQLIVLFWFVEYKMWMVYNSHVRAYSISITRWLLGERVFFCTVLLLFKKIYKLHFHNFINIFFKFKYNYAVSYCWWSGRDYSVNLIIIYISCV